MSEKRAVLLHGTDGAPHHSWFPWLKSYLESKGFSVFVPQLPGSHTPNASVYKEFLLDQDWDYSNNLVVGHSSGATTTLNLAMSDSFPKMKTVILVGAFLNENLVKNAEFY